MKIKALIALIVLSLTLLFCCSKYKEEAPFFDGLILEYEIGPLKYLYKVNVLDNNKYKMTRTESGLLSDKTREVLVDKYGKVYNSHARMQS